MQNNQKKKKNNNKLDLTSLIKFNEVSEWPLLPSRRNLKYEAQQAVLRAYVTAIYSKHLYIYFKPLI